MRLRRAGSALLDPLPLETAKQYIENRIRRIDESGCWIWCLSTYNGYGKSGVGGVLRPAHVVAFEAWKGPLPDGLQVNHKCHVRACCNPEHLYAGTQKQNVADMFAAGRQKVLRGEQNGHSRLTEALVAHIRSSSSSARQLREQIGVSDSLIRAVRKRVIWKHVP